MRVCTEMITQKQGIDVPKGRETGGGNSTRRLLIQANYNEGSEKSK